MSTMAIMQDDDLDLTAKQLAAEVAALEQLTDDIDQAASLALDCRTLCPEARDLLRMELRNQAVRQGGIAEI